MSLFTVGHSTRTLDELVDLLREHDIELLADVRTAPASRRLPHFSKAALAALLPARGLAYVHLPELGGFRRPRPGSPNDGWRNQSFRGYADYMASPEWREAFERLVGLAGERRVAARCRDCYQWT